MRLLLDTHTVAWWAEDSNILPEAICDQIDDPSNLVFIRAVSIYEIAYKHGRGKWPGANLLIDVLYDLIPEYFPARPLSVEHARAAGQFPNAHRDPFDRMLAAQAKVDDLTIVSIDDKLDGFGVRRLW